MSKKHEINNAHDKYFKEVFSRRDEAVSFLKGTLPVDIFRHLNPESIKPANTHYITKELQESMSDVVYEADYSGFPIKLTFIIEHKSYVPKFPFVQFLLYFANCIAQQVKQKKKGEELKLAFPIIIVVHHSEQEWKIKPVWEYFGNVPEVLRLFIPAFEYILVDLTKEDYLKIKERYDSLILQISFMTMKGTSDQQNFEAMTAFIFSELSRLLTDENGTNFFESTLLYLFDRTEIDEDKFVETITEITKQGGHKAMTVKEKLFAKGRKEGIIKGIEKGREEGKIIEKAENAIQMHIEGLEISLIMKITKLKKEEIQILIALHNQFNKKALDHIDIIGGEIKMK